MLRHGHPRPHTISDRELGIAAMILLAGMVLAVALVPGLF